MSMFNSLSLYLIYLSRSSPGRILPNPWSRSSKPTVNRSWSHWRYLRPYGALGGLADELKQIKTEVGPIIAKETEEETELRADTQKAKLNLCRSLTTPRF